MARENLVFEDFKDLIGSTFTVIEVGLPPMSLALDEAKALQNRNPLPNSRPPFSLIFVCEDQSVLPQGLYRLAHDGMGDVTLFLVPVGRDERGVSYQALFN